MEYEPYVLINENWESCDTYFDDPTDAYNYLVRYANECMQIKGLKVINITTQTTEIEEML